MSAFQMQVQRVRGCKGDACDAAGHALVGRMPCEAHHEHMPVRGSPPPLPPPGPPGLCPERTLCCPRSMPAAVCGTQGWAWVLSLLFCVTDYLQVLGEGDVPSEAGGDAVAQIFW